MLREPLTHEAGEDFRVLRDSPELLVRVAPDCTRIPGADGIDEDQIGEGEPGLVVVHQSCRPPGAAAGGGPTVVPISLTRIAT